MIREKIANELIRIRDMKALNREQKDILADAINIIENRQPICLEKSTSCFYDRENNINLELENYELKYLFKKVLMENYDCYLKTKGLKRKEKTLLDFLINEYELIDVCWDNIKEDLQDEVIRYAKDNKDQFYTSIFDGR